jgi:hypothetical protein
MSVDELSVDESIAEHMVQWKSNGLSRGSRTTHSHGPVGRKEPLPLRKARPRARQVLEETP